MNKEVFINELELKLKRLPKEELEDALMYYKEYFEEAGIGDTEDVSSLFDSPSDIASQILSQYAFKESDNEETKAKKGVRTIWFVILAIFAAPIALPLAIAAVAIIFALLIVLLAIGVAFIAVNVSLIVAGVFSLITAFAVISQSFWTSIFYIGIAFILTGVGILMGILIKTSTPKISALIISFIKKMLNKFNNKNK